MIGDVQVSSLKGAMNVRHSSPILFALTKYPQLWLDNRAGMELTLSSTLAKVSSTLSSLYNSFLGQSRSQARLNAIASYDQSNELFKVYWTIDLKIEYFLTHFFPIQGFLE